MNHVAKLESEVEYLREKLSEYEQKVAERDQQVALLKEQLQAYLQRRFAASSEKVSVDQLGLFNEAEVESHVSNDSDDESLKTEVKNHTRKKRPRVSIPQHYPREEIVYDLSEEDKVCPHDGHTLNVMGSEDHEQLDIIPAQIKVLLHKRLKYACPCCDKHIVTAQKPKQPIEKSIASPGLLAYIAVQKYCDALPLYRQTEILKRAGFELDRTNLANWMIRCGELVQPLINLLQDHLRQQRLLHLDETTLQVLDEPGKSAQSKSYLWLMAVFGQQPAMVFHYSPTRSQSVPLELLSESTAAIMVDGYEGYQSACKEYDITRLGCMAHARRKFFDPKKLQKPGKTGKADQGLAFIQKLYAIERKIADEPPDKRYEYRQQHAAPVFEKMKTWMEKSILKVLPESEIGKALKYLSNQWGRLTRYLEDGGYPIDNNLAENAIRPFTVGRRNWLFAKSQAGAKASANLYSLIETAKANKLNPHEYLRHVFKELPNANSVEDVEALLPWNLKLG